MGNLLIALLFLLTITYPLVAIPATGSEQAIALFGLWGIAIAGVALVTEVRDADDG